MGDFFGITWSRMQTMDVLVFCQPIALHAQKKYARAFCSNNTKTRFGFVRQTE